MTVIVRSQMWVILCLCGVALLSMGCEDEFVDKRPEGTLQDITSLAEREDLNILFVVIDTLRSDRLSSYGYERETSPVLDYLAGTGVRFANHRAQSSWTKASMASLWTGLYPVRTDVLRHKDALTEEAYTPAEILGDAGYLTAGIWRNGWVAPNFGFSQGFDIYLSPALNQAPAKLRTEARAGRIEGTDVDLAFSATEFIRTHSDQRWFLYLHFMDVHQYISTEETAIFGSTYSDAYDNSILWTDRQLGNILRELYELGLEDRTLIVVVSDHGEAFGENGAEGHGRDVHAEVVLTPFIISFPFKLDPAGVVQAQTENVDVWPTVLDMLGLASSNEGAVDGTSQVPLLTVGQVAPMQDTGFAQLDRNWGRIEEESRMVIAVRDGPLRLVHDPTAPESDLLYNVELDPLEQTNIAEIDPENLEKLKHIAEEHLARKPVWEGGAPQVEIDEMHLKQLRAIGYSIEE
ncbi:MAG: hypothetical protein CL917_15535 [Deltaproteobacteria bacterium]|nr:hypothetical protein [Deltaproteobacteria bacterium]